MMPVIFGRNYFLVARRFTTSTTTTKFTTKLEKISVVSQMLPRKFKQMTTLDMSL
jgi:hypothetical protein